MTEQKINKKASAAKSLFLGNIVEENIFPFPTIKEDESEMLKMVIDSIDKFMGDKEEIFRENDLKGSQSDEFLNSLKELGLFGVIIPEEYDGIGLSNSAYSRVIQQSSYYDGGTTLTIGAHSSIGMKGLLLFGSDDQKKKYLPKLATGENIAAFCLTESGSGSDAASIATKAEKKENGDWLLNGEKIWITNGPIADFYTVFAKTESEGKGKISAFIVEASYEGVSCGPKEDKMGIRSSATTTVIFNNVTVPKENLLGEEGKGFKIAMAILNNGRTGLGGGCVGAMKASIKHAVKQAKERKQFNTPIANFGLIQEKIANMTVDCFATESVVSVIGNYIDSGVEDYSTEAAISKIFATEALWRTANEALQIAGGNGFMKEYPYERVVRDSRINMIFEGTNEILRLFIALSAFKDAGEYLKSIGKAFNDPIKGFGLMSSYAQKKFTQFTSLGADKLDVAPEIESAARILELATLGLAKNTEAVIKKYKKEVIGKQIISKRLADACIDIFVGLCVLSRVNDLIKKNGAEKTKQEINILNIFIQQAKVRIKHNLNLTERPEDELTLELADFIKEKDGYIWDLF
ncbi:UNVERIFIED_CONTAM: hypothetical protein GTU68_004186 [Idotea baltica]|nr:hypothetical protein [Idotea baltica]